MNLFHSLSLSMLLILPCCARAQSGQVHVLCGVQAEWCAAAQASFARETGIDVVMTHKSAGEAFAQLSAERRNPSVDLWFGGTGDFHLQAAENDLTLAYKSPNIHLLRDWAATQARRAGYRSVGLYVGPLGFAVNTEALARRKLPMPACWEDLAKPIYRGQIQMANPQSSGTAYMAIATLVQLFGEEKGFRYLKELHRNVSQYPRAGNSPLKNTAAGENAVSISFVHDVPGEAMAGAPVVAVTPCEGTGYEIGSMSIVKNARHLSNAKRFYDWALTRPAQELGARARQFQLPANMNADVDAKVPDIARIRLIHYDFEKYGRSSERERLLEKWEREVFAADPLAW